MSGRLLIYGATGYTGRLVAERAVQTGLDVTVAGRDAGKVGELAGALGVESRVFDVDDAGAVRTALRDVDCVLNIAGPFRHTARQLMDAAVEAGVHYLDTTAEFGIFALAGPTADERSQGRYLAIAEVTGRNGQVVRSLINTPTGYTFTQLSSVEIARRVLDGQFTAGFQSPASAYGPELATGIADTFIIDL